MKPFEITYTLNENDGETLSIGTVANNEIKALKAFSLKVPGIPSNQIIAVNGHPVREEWFSAYPINIPKKTPVLMACPYCSAKISKRAEHCPKCNNTILKECIICGCKIRKDTKKGCPKCGDPEPFSGYVHHPDGSAYTKKGGAQLKVCPSCGCRISERAPQCPDCHTPTIALCKVCGKKISCWTQTCPECGDPEPFSKELIKGFTKKNSPNTEGIDQEHIKFDQKKPYEEKCKKADTTIVYAGFWKRLLAYIIDVLIMVVPMFIIGFFVSYFAISSAKTEFEMEAFSAGADGFTSILGLVFAWVYFATMESSSKQGSLGKMALGIKVTDYNGEKISFGKASGRFFGKILSGLLLGIGFLMVGLTSKKQGLHDIMAGTLIVAEIKNGPSIQNKNQTV